MTKLQTIRPTAINVAEDLFKCHTHAEIVFLTNPDQIVYCEADVIKILTKYGHPAPDFEGFAKTAKVSYRSQRQEILLMTEVIKNGMKKKGYNNTRLAQEMGVSRSVITRILSGANLEVTTMLKLERVLDIKLIIR